MIVIVTEQDDEVTDLANYLKAQGEQVEISTKEESLRASDRLILPNAANYAEAMGLLQERELISAIDEHTKAGKPILGIGLGMHLLFEGVMANGFTAGLEILEGLSESLPLDEAYPLPHRTEGVLIGMDEESVLTQGLTNQLVVYDHCLTVDCELEVIRALGQYSVKFPAIIQRGAIVGFQFLPELSVGGQQALDNFLNN